MGVVGDIGGSLEAARTDTGSDLVMRSDVLATICRTFWSAKERRLWSRAEVSSHHPPMDVEESLCLLDYAGGVCGPRPVTCDRHPRELSAVHKLHSNALDGWWDACLPQVHSYVFLWLRGPVVADYGCHTS